MTRRMYSDLKIFVKDQKSKMYRDLFGYDHINQGPGTYLTLFFYSPDFMINVGNYVVL